MKKHNNTDFLKDLIDSDFLFVRSTACNRVSSLKMDLQLGLSKNLGVADILESNKSVKQLIRTIKLLSKTPAFSVYIWVEDSSVAELLNNLLKKESMSISVDVKSTAPSQNKDRQATQLLLILGAPSGYVSSNIFYNFFQKNIFLICRINSQQETNLFGCYKIFNDLNDIKKIIFLSLLISKSYKKKETL